HRLGYLELSGSSEGVADSARRERAGKCKVVAVLDRLISKLRKEQRAIRRIYTQFIVLCFLPGNRVEKNAARGAPVDLAIADRMDHILMIEADQIDGSYSHQRNHLWGSHLACT